MENLRQKGRILLFPQKNSPLIFRLDFHKDIKESESKNSVCRTEKELETLTFPGTHENISNVRLSFLMAHKIQTRPTDLKEKLPEPCRTFLYQSERLWLSMIPDHNKRTIPTFFPSRKTGPVLVCFSSHYTLPLC